MEQTWRWFGTDDRVTLRDAREAGAEGIVTALHDIPAGEVWPLERIRQRQAEIEAAGLRWSVVESLDVTETVKTRSPGWERDVENFKQSLRNLATCGIRVVAYNWMPLFSWMRTHLHAPAPGGGFTTRFDATAFAAFDLYMLHRKNAEQEWGEEACRQAHTYFHALAESAQDELKATILQGLPGGNGSYTLQEVKTFLRIYEDIGDTDFRAQMSEFLQEVCPEAEELGVKMCIHPDDPPRPLLGLPRVVSTTTDLEWILNQSDVVANGITFCTGALGVRADNDLISMIRKFAGRIHFFHLRSTQRESILKSNADHPMESFFEAAHLEGDADLIAIVMEIVKEQRRRLSAGSNISIPFRADHGQELLNDRERGAAPAYPAVGRLRGLAELRGAIRMAERLMTEVA